MRYATMRIRTLYRNCTFCKLELKDQMQRRRKRLYAITNTTKGIARDDALGSTSGLGSGGNREHRKRKSLVVRAACFGHPQQPRNVVDVTLKLVSLISLHKGGSSSVSWGPNLRITTECDLMERLGVKEDPCPGEDQVVRVLYEIGGRRGDVTIDVVYDGHGVARLARELFIGMPPEPWLLITGAVFGHRLNLVKQYDITAQLQARVDGKDSQGRYLHIGRKENLIKWFGDPCFGVQKVLTVSYEVHGWVGEVRVQEAHGFLLDPIVICAPQVRPQLLIRHATWGVLDPAVFRNKRKDARPSWLTRFSIEVDCLDNLQPLVDREGAGRRLLITPEESLESILGVADPCPGTVKTLYIEYVARGRKCRIRAETGEGAHLVQTLCLEAHTIQAGRLGASRFKERDMMVAPRLQLLCCSYGHETDTSQSANVLSALQTRLDESYPPGSELRIGTEEPLEPLLGDPCPGEFKTLTVRYEIRGWSGELELDVHDPSVKRTNHIGVECGMEMATKEKLESAWAVKSAMRREEAHREKEEKEGKERKRMRGVSRYRGVDFSKTRGGGSTTSEEETVTSVPPAASSSSSSPSSSSSSSSVEGLTKLVINDDTDKDSLVDSGVILGRTGELPRTVGSLICDLHIGWLCPHPIWPSPRADVAERYTGDINSGGIAAGTFGERFFPDTQSTLSPSKMDKSFRLEHGFTPSRKALN